MRDGNYVTPDERKRYEAIEEFLTDEERQRVEARRVDYEEKQRPNGYGHDLIAAIAHGHRRRARELVDAAMDRNVLAGSYGKGMEDEERAARHAFGLTLYTLIEAAGARGVSEEDVRHSFQRRLDATDSSRIDRLLERGRG